jgi:hypothetical protein
MIIDSIQTVPLSPDEDASNPRLATAAKMRYFRRMAARYGVIWILASQSPRASYRSKKAEDNSQPMAAFAESAAVEFMSDVAIYMQPRDEKSGIVDVMIPKNRLTIGKGGRKPFAVRYDDERGQMIEVDEAVAEEQATTERETVKRERTDRARDEQRGRVRDFFRSLPPDTNGHHHRLLAGNIASETGIRKQDSFRLLAQMVQDGELRAETVTEKGRTFTRYSRGPRLP